jgi:hypothetical protein
MNLAEDRTCRVNQFANSGVCTHYGAPLASKSSLFTLTWKWKYANQYLLP